jgi:hypothetical protein
MTPECETPIDSTSMEITFWNLWSSKILVEQVSFIMENSLHLSPSYRTYMLRAVRNIKQNRKKLRDVFHKKVALKE